MLKMNAYVTDTKDDRSANEPDQLAIDPQEQERQYGQACARRREAEERAVEVLQGVSAVKVADPEALIEDHEQDREYQPHGPVVKSMRIKIIETEDRDGAEDLTDSLKGHQHRVFT